MELKTNKELKYVTHSFKTTKLKTKGVDSDYALRLVSPLLSYTFDHLKKRCFSSSSSSFSSFFIPHMQSSI